nr:putative late blight resistance protein homolog R1B-14 [Ipomoea batatas]
MAAYAAVVSLINRLNEHMCFDHIWLDYLTFYCRAILDKYKSAEDRESLESVFRAAIGEGLLPNFFLLICRLDELLNSQQIACPRKFGEFLSHYNLYFPREALRNFRPNQGLVEEHVLDCYKVILDWKHLDGYLNCPCYIQDLKASVCLVETFLRYHPPMNKNDQKQIQVLANEAEALVDTVNAHPNPPYMLRASVIETEALVETFITHFNPQPNLGRCRVKDHSEMSESHSKMYKMQKKFEWLSERKWQYESSTTCTNDFVANHSLCSSLSTSFDDLPPSVSKLYQLQTLVRHCHEARLILPKEIWIMKWLRHLYFKKSCSLQFPKIFPERRGAQGSELYLPNLQTLSTLSFGSCFEEILTRLPNLKKLGLREEEGERLSDEKLLYLLNNLKVLSCLETLKCFFTKQRPLPMPDAFPPNLKHLTLQGCRRPWKEMSILSALPKLEVLKLKDCAFEGSKWELTEEEVFCQLKAMVIDIADLEQWEACSIHFPNLHSLVLKYCKHLNEIPIGIGDINTLQLIELWACSTSAYDSAERIQEEQQNSGNDGLTVRIHRVHNDEWHTYTPGSSSAANSEVEI